MRNKFKYNRNSIILMAMLIAIGTSSCRTNKNVSDLSFDTNDLIRDSKQNSSDTTTIANIPWQDYFSDAPLKQLITESLVQNLDMQVAIERINQAQANFGMAKAAKLPTLSIGIQDDYTSFSNKDGVKDVFGYETNSLSLGFSTSWEIDAWGKLNSAKKAQYANLLNSFEYINLVQTDIIANIAGYYYNLIALDEKLRITKETIDLLKESSETMEALKQGGLINGAAVEQSKALLYSTQLSVFDIESQIRQQENAISVLLGKKPGAINRSSINDQSVPTEMKSGVPAQMLAKRPDVKRAEFTFRAAFEMTNSAQASLYPSFTISSGSIGYNASEFSNFFQPENLAANIVAGITQPLFNKKQLRGNLAVAKSQQKEAYLNFNKVVLSAGQEVSDILYGFESSLNKNEFRNQQVQSLITAVDFTQELLKAGEANYTEVLSAQQNLLSAQLSKVNDMLEQLNYSVTLYKALGGGVK